MSKVHKEAAVQPATPTRGFAGEFISAALAPAVRRLDGSETAIRLESDSEHVHQARVATRRLRSNLRTFAVLLDTHWAGQLRTELDWLAAAFGAVRDREVLRERLLRSAGQLRTDDREPAEALLSRLAAERDCKRAELLIILDSDRYRELLVALQAAVERPALSSAAGPGWDAQLRSACLAEPQAWGREAADQAIGRRAARDSHSGQTLPLCRGSHGALGWLCGAAICLGLPAFAGGVGRASGCGGCSAMAARYGRALQLARSLRRRAAGCPPT